MTGLVFVDTLELSLVQWIALLASMAMMFRFPGWKSIALSHLLLLCVFWNVALSTDTRLLFQACKYLQRFTWSQFLSEFAFRDYVKLQPPFYTFWVSRWPSLPGHQIMQAGIGAGCSLLLLSLFGGNARYLVSTPVYLLMSVQPGNDFMLFALVLITLRLLQRQKLILAAGVYGLTWMIKPLTVLTLPFMAWHLKTWILGSMAIWAVYVIWSLNYYFGVMQWQFFCQQTLLQRFFVLFAGAGSTSAFLVCSASGSICSPRMPSSGDGQAICSEPCV